MGVSVPAGKHTKSFPRHEKVVFLRIKGKTNGERKTSCLHYVKFDDVRLLLAAGVSQDVINEEAPRLKSSVKTDEKLPVHVSL